MLLFGFFTMNDYKSREIVMVIGRTGQGKSIWTRIYSKPFKRVFAFDPLREFRANYVTEEGLIKLHDESLLSADHNMRIGVSDIDSIDLLGSLAFVHGNAWLIIEEGGFIFPNGSRSPNWLREACFLGRHRELNILITAQRPTSIPVDLRSQASRVICFNQREQNDMKWLDSYYGDRTDEILSLEPLECLDATSQEIARYKIDPKMDDKMEIIEENPEENSSAFEDLGYK